jgi:hypothetical protein
MIMLYLHYKRSYEYFAASQGGALIQLAAGHVASEAEVAANFEYQKRQIAKDIQDMTEPSTRPFPA